MQVLKVNILILALLLFFQAGEAQIQAQALDTAQAKHYLQRIYDETADKVNKALASSTTGFYMKYEMETSRLENEEELSNTEIVEVISGKNVNCLFNKHIQVISDSLSTFTIFPLDEAIVIHNASPSSFNKSFVHSFGEEIKGIIAQAKVLRYEEKDSVVYLTLGLEETLYPYETISYQLDQKKQALKRVEMNYKKGREYTFASVSFTRTDYQYAHPLLKGMAKDAVYGKDGALKPEFIQYKVDDKRKK